MIKKWVRYLPYALVFRLMMGMSHSVGTFENKKCMYHQISEGEFVVFSPEIQKAFDDRRKKRNENKTNRRKEKLINELAEINSKEIRNSEDKGK